MPKHLDRRLSALEQTTQRRTAGMETFNAHLRIAYGEPGEAEGEPLTREQIVAAIAAAYGEMDDAPNPR